MKFTTVIMLFLAILLSSLSTHSFADNFFDGTTDYHLKFGGWSQHSVSEKFGKYDFNESHNGIGFQIWKGISQSNWHVGLDAFAMKDSLDFEAVMISAVSKYEWNLNNQILTSINTLVGLTYHSRGFMIFNYYKENGNYITTNHKLYRDQIITPSLMLTLTWFEFFETDLSYVPKTSYNSYSAAFLRLGVRF
jgi:hypothetical protein